MATLREEAYGRITDLLNTGRLTPGLIVSQRQLVERTGSTLGAVREAVPRLEAEGLLVPLNQRGLQVPPIDATFVRNAYHLRKLLEMEAIRAAPENMGVSAICSLVRKHDAALEKIRKAPSQKLADRVQSMDWALHQDLIDSLGNGLISSVYRVNAIKVRMAKQARLQVTADNAVRVLGEHLEFLNALVAGNVEEARLSLARHLDNSADLAMSSDTALFSDSALSADSGLAGQDSDDRCCG